MRRVERLQSTEVPLRSTQTGSAARVLLERRVSVLESMGIGSAMADRGAREEGTRRVVPSAVFDHALSAGIGVAVDAKVRARVVHADVFRDDAAAGFALAFVFEIRCLRDFDFRLSTPKLFRKSYSKLLDVFSDFFPHFTSVRAAFSKVGCIQLKPLEGQ